MIKVAIYISLFRQKIGSNYTEEDTNERTAVYVSLVYAAYRYLGAHVDVVSVAARLHISSMVR